MYRHSDSRPSLSSAAMRRAACRLNNQPPQYTIGPIPGTRDGGDYLPVHPLCGTRVSVFRGPFRSLGQPIIDVDLPDGRRQRLPLEWTDRMPPGRLGLARVLFAPGALLAAVHWVGEQQEKLTGQQGVERSSDYAAQHGQPSSDEPNDGVPLRGAAAGDKFSRRRGPQQSPALGGVDGPSGTRGRRRGNQERGRR